MRYFLFTCLFCVIIFTKLNAQVNSITTVVPALLINENAQTGGMGDIGTVATEFNYNAAYLQNPSLIARNRKVLAGFINHTPWLRSLVPDVNLLNAGFVYSPDGKNGFSYAISFNSLGKITFTNSTGLTLGEYRPYEIFNSLRYARALSDNFSVGVGYKHIFSKLGPYFMGNKLEGMSHSGDIGIDYRSKVYIKEKQDLRLNIGASALNLGQKLSYTSHRSDFIPSVLKVATMASLNNHLENNDLFTISFSYQAQKLLVPTPPIYDQNYRIIAGRDPDIGVVEGILGSFSDAPGTPVLDENGNYFYKMDGTIEVEGGSVLKEELNEIIHQFGIEARYYVPDTELTFAYRAGYFHEHANKGNRKFITTGAGVQRKAYSVDLAYYIPVVTRHPLAHTIIVAFSYQLFR